MAREYPKESREQAAQTAFDRVTRCGVSYKTAKELGPKPGVKRAALRQWVVQSQVDRDQTPKEPRTPRALTDVQAEIQRLQAEIRELTEANEILKSNLFSKRTK